MPSTIKTYIKKKKLTATEFAHLIGVSQATISKHINAMQRLSPETAEAVERITESNVPRLYAMWPELIDPQWGKAYKANHANRRKKDCCE